MGKMRGSALRLLDLVTAQPVSQENTQWSWSGEFWPTNTSIHFCIEWFFVCLLKSFVKMTKTGIKTVVLL